MGLLNPVVDRLAGAGRKLYTPRRRPYLLSEGFLPPITGKGRDDPFRTRFTAFPAVGEGSQEEAIINSMAMQITTDFFTQLALSGFTYQIQIGTEDAGATFTAIDDALATMLVDQSVGNAMIPLHYQVTPGVLATATLAMAMLEMDKEKIRFASGGTAVTPENLNGLDRESHTGSAYISGASDVVAAAKSAVPDSVELARAFFTEDALTDSIGYPGGWNTTVYDVHQNPMAVAVDAAALVGHAGAATADLTGYGTLAWAQFAKAQLG